MDKDFIVLENVYLTGAKPYSVDGEGANKGKTYKGKTYSFLYHGDAFKLSSPTVDLEPLIDVITKEPLGGSMRVSIEVKGGYIKPVLLGFDPIPVPKR